MTSITTGTAGDRVTMGRSGSFDGSLATHDGPCAGRQVELEARTVDDRVHHCRRTRPPARPQVGPDQVGTVGPTRIDIPIRRDLVVTRPGDPPRSREIPSVYGGLVVHTPRDERSRRIRLALYWAMA